MNPRPRKCLEIARGSCGVLAARWSPASLGTGKDTGGSRDTQSSEVPLRSGETKDKLFTPVRDLGVFLRLFTCECECGLSHRVVTVP